METTDSKKQKTFINSETKKQITLTSTYKINEKITHKP